MLNSDLSPAAPQGGRLPPTDKTRVVSTRRRVPTNWVSGRTLQPSIESVVANSFVPSDFLVDGQLSGLGTVHPLLTLSFVSTWILPLHIVSSTLKRKSSSSVMDGLQRRRRRRQSYLTNNTRKLKDFVFYSDYQNYLCAINSRIKSNGKFFLCRH